MRRRLPFHHIVQCFAHYSLLVFFHDRRILEQQAQQQPFCSLVFQRAAQRLGIGVRRCKHGPGEGPVDGIREVLCPQALGYRLAQHRLVHHQVQQQPLGLVLGPIFENSLRQSLTLSHGGGAIFLTRPISAVLLALAVVALTAPLWTRIFRAKTV